MSHDYQVTKESMLKWYMYPSMIVESRPGWKGAKPGIAEIKERKEPQGLNKLRSVYSSI